MNLICAELRKSKTNEATSSIFLSESIEQWYSILKNDKNEVFLLNTCHRFMVLIRNECKLTLDSFFTQLNIDAQPEYCYNEEAVLHFFSVASGVQSPILGENEILGQIKRFGEEASQKGMTNTFLNELVNKAVFTGKAARTKTGLVKISDTYSSIAAQFIRQHIPDLSDKKILILGTGKLGVQLFNHFQNKTLQPITIASRSLERAVEVAGEKAVGTTIGQMENPLTNFDVIIGATEAQSPVWEFGHLYSPSKKVIIDLGMPANFATCPASVNVYYYDLQTIQNSMQITRKAKMDEVPKVMRIVQKETDNFKYWYNTRKVVPVIQSFNRLAATIKEEEYQWAINKLGNLSEQQQEIVQKLIYRVVSRMSSNPISTIKGYAQEDTKSVHIDTFKEMFNIQIEGE